MTTKKQFCIGNKIKRRPSDTIVGGTFADNIMFPVIQTKAKNKFQINIGQQMINYLCVPCKVITSVLTSFSYGEKRSITSHQNTRDSKGSVSTFALSKH